MAHAPRHSTESEIDDLAKVCEQLAGFDADVSIEWVDGYLTALAASRRAILPTEWLGHLFGDAFDRAFADPASVERAMRPLVSRWNVLASQLNAEALLEVPEDLRLAPLMLTYDDEMRAEAVAAGHMDATEAADMLQTGALWAEGFHDAIKAFADDWPEPDLDSESGVWYDSCLTRVAALLLPQSELVLYVEVEYPKQQLARDQLVDEACYAVQDLRVHWIEFAPKPETRLVDAKPGRNDPCPCGSGKKFKKCHGA